MYNIKAALLLKTRQRIAEGRFAQLTIWQVPRPVRGSAHGYKYSLALVADGVCVMRYDNEAGKGDHKHVGDAEMAYTFRTLDQLIDDFWADVARL
jgi:hypothetical protein